MLPPRAGISVRGELISGVVESLNRCMFEESGFDRFAVRRNFIFYNGKNLFHLPGQPVGFVDAADGRVAKTGAQQRRQLSTLAVYPFVVHFDHEHMVKTGENVLQAGWQRTERTNM